jgi:3-deoxy-D-manno-octulosonate 8-phosphate phosphatase (KDO 8-P phosphatase)
MQKVALAFAVADAHPEARHAAHLVTKLPGGHGAVREVCDYLLTHSGLTHPALTRPGHKARGR